MPVSYFRARKNDRIRTNVSLQLFPFADQFTAVWTDLPDGYSYLEVEHDADREKILREVLSRGKAPLEILVLGVWRPLETAVRAGDRQARPYKPAGKQKRRRRRGGSHAA